MTAPVDISPLDLEIVRGVLFRSLSPGVKVWVFGSRAKWTTKSSSDLDLAIDAGRPLTREESAALRDGFEDSDLSYTVDVVDWTTISDGFRRAIERDRVPLPGPTAAQWPTREISQLIGAGCLIIGDGYRAKNEELSKFGLPFARAGNINGGFHFEDADCLPNHKVKKFGEKVSQPGDVVFTSKGTVGRIAFVRDQTPRFVYSPQLCFWRSMDPNIIDPKFLFFWMSGNEFYNQFKGVSGQTDMAEYVSLTDQRRMKITLPPIKEQQTIASVLGSLDDKIELNRQMNETLEAMARALFKDWFVDFGPTRAKMEGRTPYLAPEIWSLFPDRLDDEGKPEGWKMQTLGEIFNVGIGRTPPRNEAVHFVPVGAGHTWLSIKNMGGLNVWARRSDENLARESVKRLNIPVVPENTVVVSFKLTVGRVAITSHSMCTNEAIAHLVRPKSSPYGPCYTYLYMVNYDYGQLGSTSSIATAVNSKSIKSIKFLNPGKICLNAFEEIASLIFSKIRANLDEVETLSATRDLLLPKLMSGEIRIKDAEKALEAVA